MTSRCLQANYSPYAGYESCHRYPYGSTRTTPSSSAFYRHSLATSAPFQGSERVALYRSMIGSTCAGTPSAICLVICEQSAAVCAPTLAHGEIYCGDSASGLGRPAGAPGGRAILITSGALWKSMSNGQAACEDVRSSGLMLRRARLRATVGRLSFRLTLSAAISRVRGRLRQF